LWEKMPEIRPAKLDVPGADAVAFEQASLPSLVAGFAFIGGYRLLASAAGFLSQPFGDG